jgi:hypothetical protein
MPTMRRWGESHARSLGRRGRPRRGHSPRGIGNHQSRAGSLPATDDSRRADVWPDTIRSDALPEVARLAAREEVGMPSAPDGEALDRAGGLRRFSRSCCADRGGGRRHRRPLGSDGVEIEANPTGLRDPARLVSRPRRWSPSRDTAPGRWLRPRPRRMLVRRALGWCRLRAALQRRSTPGLRRRRGVPIAGASPLPR